MNGNIVFEEDIDPLFEIMQLSTALEAIGVLLSRGGGGLVPQQIRSLAYVQRMVSTAIFDLVGEVDS